MSSSDCCYGSCFEDFINAFPTEEVERMIFGDPSPTLRNTSLLDWALALTRDPSSPPALASFSRDTSPALLEGVPEPSMAFYAFIEGKYDSRLFVPDPFNYFLGNGTSTSSSGESMRTHPVFKRKHHPYFL
ncbi:hypothetical protein O181_092853 [Austropuccinia psidii MF-1]|uniref:Uncharacterized protein n=1 Tax=Austropuccinia psidii MF-1 TaxID=1389203 RepID=A0A9Q3J050_9BASI|nr:hypothetical protein [Austropuccinia psidii MF-1]